MGSLYVAGLSCLESLMELYCGNNLVQDLREVTHLRDLNKLIILDLTGNTLTTSQEYRLFTIYHISRLKARPQAVQLACTLCLNHCNWLLGMPLQTQHQGACDA